MSNFVTSTTRSLRDKTEFQDNAQAETKLQNKWERAIMARQQANMIMTDIGDCGDDLGAAAVFHLPRRSAIEVEIEAIATAAYIDYELSAAKLRDQ